MWAVRNQHNLAQVQCCSAPYLCKHRYLPTVLPSCQKVIMYLSVLSSRVSSHSFRACLIGWVSCLAYVFPSSLTASSSLLRSSGNTPANTYKASKLAVAGTPRHTARPLRCTLSSISHFPDCHIDAVYSSCGTTILLYSLTILAGSILSVFPKILRADSIFCAFISTASHGPGMSIFHLGLLLVI